MLISLTLGFFERCCQRCQAIMWLCHYAVPGTPRSAFSIFATLMTTSGIINLGILSHVDAGKTTTSEHIFFLGGTVGAVGDVNKGTTLTDSMEIERRRGVSVRAAYDRLLWKGQRINLIDTPGHADFSAEVERALQILDGAILVVSAVEGMQAHTYTLWHALKSRDIPVIFFINKTDRAGADFEKVLQQLQSELGIALAPLTFPVGQGEDTAAMATVFDENDPGAENYRRFMIENLADHDNEILDVYLEGKPLEPAYVLSKLQKQVVARKLFPVLAGAAKWGRGIVELLDAAVRFIPPTIDTATTLSAIVFKVENDNTLGHLAHVRLFDGNLKVRDKVWNHTRQLEEKVAQIKKRFNGRLTDETFLSCGDIGIVSGLSQARIGDILGDAHAVPPTAQVMQPVLTVQVLPADPAQFVALATALTQIDKEDPRLALQWHKKESELHVQLMGKIQLEILADTLLSQYGLQVQFGAPSIIYKETPANSAFGFASYTMPKPCWAVVKFLVEPAATGSGITYASTVSTDKIRQKYQNEIAGIIAKSLEQGIRGWEVTDVKITLADGEDHEMHSRPGDFIIATPMALMDALTKSDTILLEPVFDFTIIAAETLLGKVAADLHQMRATFDTPSFSGENFTLHGTVPAATSTDYATRLASLSGGLGQLRLSLRGYQPCPPGEGVSRPYKGVNPLDRSQWILHARGAFKADERRM
ncbi:MAG TPA: translation factor GTPase family protein [Bacteroidales bacterium]|nr:translation factor GTPase family protein [Bacteroidales bacterium]